MIQRILHRFTMNRYLYDIKYKIPVGAWKRISAASDQLSYSAEYNGRLYEVHNWDITDGPWGVYFCYDPTAQDKAKSGDCVKVRYTKVLCADMHDGYLHV